MKEPFIYYQVGGGWLASFEGEELLKKYGLKEGRGGGVRRKNIQRKREGGSANNSFIFCSDGICNIANSLPEC